MLKVLDQSEDAKWRSEFLKLRNQDVCYMSEMELPNAPTQERAEELCARPLLGGSAIPEGNRTVSWIWRGSLKPKDSLGTESGHDEYGEGWCTIRLSGSFANIVTPRVLS